MSNYWKIECLSCGVNVDLLMNRHMKIICRKCLNDYELTEVKNESQDYTSEEKRMADSYHEQFDCDRDEH
jgi:hypothetical protein